MYGSEFWAINIKEKIKIKVAEIRMLRLMCGWTRLDKLRMEYIREN